MRDLHVYADIICETIFNFLHNYPERRKIATLHTNLKLKGNHHAKQRKRGLLRGFSAQCDDHFN
jgi:hypothetical protein